MQVAKAPLAAPGYVARLDAALEQGALEVADAHRRGDVRQPEREVDSVAGRVGPLARLLRLCARLLVLCRLWRIVRKQREKIGSNGSDFLNYMEFFSEKSSIYLDKFFGEREFSVKSFYVHCFMQNIEYTTEISINS